MKLTKISITLCLILLTSMAILALTQTAVAVTDVQFVANGLPNGYTWSVTYNGVQKFAATNVIDFSAADGNWSWTAQTPIAGASGVQYVTSVSTGYLDTAAALQFINYTTQYQVAFAQSGVGTDFTGTVVTVNSTTYDRTGYTAWVNSGDALVFSYSTPLTVTVNNKQYVLTGASATSPLTVTAPTTVTGTYRTQYMVIFAQSGVGTDYATANVMTVNGTSYDRNGYGAWFNSGDVLTFTYNTPLTATAQVKQYVLTGASTTSPMTVSGAVNVTGTYKIQYNVTYIQTGVGTDFTGTVVTVGGTPYDRTGYSTWCDNNTASPAFTYSSPLVVSAGQQQYLLASTNATTGFTVVNRTTVTGTYKNQFYVTLTQTGVGSNLGANFVGTSNVTGTTAGFTYSGVSGWFNSSDKITFAYNATALVVSPANTQYLIVGTANATSPITVSAPTTVNANFKTQYYVIFNQTGLGNDFSASTTVLTVNSTTYNRNTINFTSGGWYDSGSTLNVAYANITVTANNKQYNVASVNATSPITVSGRTTVLGTYTPQFYVTFNTNGLTTGDYTTADVMTVNTLPYDRTGTSIWVDNNTAVTFSYNSPLVVSANAKQYVHTAANATTGLIITSKTVVTGNYTTQYYISFATYGIGSDYTNADVMAVNNTYYGQAGYSTWADSGTKYVFNYTSPLTVSTTRQYTRTSTNATSILTLSAGTTVMANYSSQWYLNVVSANGVTSGTGFYTDGTIATFSVTTPVVSGSTQNTFTAWSGNSTASTNSATINMTGPATVTANWKTQYYIGVTTAHGQASGTGYYDLGANVTLGISNVDDVGGGVRYVFTSWSDGSTNPTIAVTVSKAQNFSVNWKAQYYLAVTSDQGSPTGAGWYDDGATANFAVTSPVSGSATGTQYAFTAWTGDSSATSPTGSVTMTGPKSVSAHWKLQYFVTVTSSGASASGEGWYDAGSTATVSVSSTEGFAGWKIDNVLVGYDASLAVPVNAPMAIEATWEQIGGTISPMLILGGIVAGFVVVLVVLLLLLRKR